jgi:hypothetical protein
MIGFDYEHKKKSVIYYLEEVQKRQQIQEQQLDRR